MLAGIEAPVEQLGIQPDFPCVPLKIGRPQRLLVVEEGVVVLPEATLIVRAMRGDGGTNRVGMRRQRKVLPDELHLIAVLRQELSEHRRCAPAVGTLEIRELDDFDSRTSGPSHGII